MEENQKLIECPDCNQTVSRRATACPHCGAPLRQEKAEESETKPAKNYKLSALAGVAGGVLLIVSMFLPFAQIPIAGGVPFTTLGQGLEAAILGLLTLLAILFAARANKIGVVVMCIIIGLFLAWDSSRVFQAGSEAGPYGSVMIQAGVGMILMWCGLAAMLLSNLIKDQ